MEHPGFVEPLERRAAFCAEPAGVLVARAIISPTLLLKAGVSNGAISLLYIQSRADLSELDERLLSIPFSSPGMEACDAIKSVVRLIISIEESHCAG